MCVSVCLSVCQNRSSSSGNKQEREELNDIQVRIAPMSRSRSSLNALESGTAANNRDNAHNTLTVTTAIVTMSTPSTTSETESVQTQSTSGTLSPATQSQPGVVRISTL